MARHTAKTESTELWEKIQDMDEQELNEYSNRAMKRLIIRTAVGTAIGAAIGISLNILVARVLDKTQPEDSSNDDEN